MAQDLDSTGRSQSGRGGICRAVRDSLPRAGAKWRTGRQRQGPHRHHRAGGSARAIVGESQDVASKQIVAVCDCYMPQVERFVKDVGQEQKWAAYDDVREMLDKEKLDGVMVETTTHARAWVALHAMQAGLDVYIEKPMCLTIAEGREMVKAARKLGRVTQVGTQQRSMPINNWASDLVKNGGWAKYTPSSRRISSVRSAGPASRNSRCRREAEKAGGTAGRIRPSCVLITRNYTAAGRRGGTTMAAGCVSESPAGVRIRMIRSSGLWERTKRVPSRSCWKNRSSRCGRASSSAGPTVGEVGDEDTGKDYHQMARDVIGPRAKVTMKFANGTLLKLHLDGERGPGLGAIFVGDKGKLEINRNKLASNPKDLILAADNPGPITRPETAYHVENWIDCIKSRQRCNADIEYGQRSSTLCYLVNIVRDVGRVGEWLKWDPVAERFTNCEEGNKMLSRPRRQGYELPSILDRVPAATARVTQPRRRGERALGAGLRPRRNRRPKVSLRGFTRQCAVPCGWGRETAPHAPRYLQHGSPDPSKRNPLTAREGDSYHDKPRTDRCAADARVVSARGLAGRNPGRGPRSRRPRRAGTSRRSGSVNSRRCSSISATASTLPAWRRRLFGPRL